AASGQQFGGDPFLGASNFGGGLGARLFQQSSALIEPFFASCFLLGIHLSAGLTQRILILFDLFRGSRLSRFGGFLRADGTRFAPCRLWISFRLSTSIRHITHALAGLAGTFIISLASMGSR